MTRAWREFFSPLGSMWKDLLTGDIISDEEMSRQTVCDLSTKFKKSIVDDNNENKMEASNK